MSLTTNAPFYFLLYFVAVCDFVTVDFGTISNRASQTAAWQQLAHILVKCLRGGLRTVELCVWVPWHRVQRLANQGASAFTQENREAFEL